MVRQTVSPISHDRDDAIGVSVDISMIIMVGAYALGTSTGNMNRAKL